MNGDRLAVLRALDRLDDPAEERMRVLQDLDRLALAVAGCPGGIDDGERTGRPLLDGVADAKAAVLAVGYLCASDLDIDIVVNAPDAPQLANRASIEVASVWRVLNRGNGSNVSPTGGLGQH